MNARHERAVQTRGPVLAKPGRDHGRMPRRKDAVRIKVISMLVLQCAALLLVASPASADPITFNYGMSGSAWNNNNPPNTTSFQIGDSGVVTVPNSSPVTITAGAGPSSTYENLPTPGSFTNVPIAVSVSLTDVAAQAVPGAVPSGSLVFTGVLSGQFDHAEDGWTLTATPSTQAITLGSPGQFHTYTVGAPYFWNPSFGTLYATASVQVTAYQPSVGPAPGTISAAPEPASFLLVILGLPVFIVGRRAWTTGTRLAS